MAFGWHRTPFGVVHFKDTTLAGLSSAMSKIDADCITSPPVQTAVAAEATYETDKSTLTGADANLAMVVSGNTVPLTASNPGQ